MRPRLEGRIRYKESEGWSVCVRERQTENERQRIGERENEGRRKREIVRHREKMRD